MGVLSSKLLLICFDQQSNCLNGSQYKHFNTEIFSESKNIKMLKTTTY